MTLNSEWRDRVDSWTKELPHHFYRPIQMVEWEGFTTTEQLSLTEAASHRRSPMPEGTAWGAKWEYGWFFSTIALPMAAASERIELNVEVGPESIIYVDGVSVGARDREHSTITLSFQGIPGTTYEIAAECYAGHGVRICSVGPVPNDRETVPEPPAEQAIVGHSTIGIWEEELYQLWMDVMTLYSLRDQLDPESLRVNDIDAGLKDFTLMVELEEGLDELKRTAAEARVHLVPLLEAVNGSTAPLLYVFGHAHIDVAWLWNWAETERKAVRTFSTQLTLAEEYPEYKFLQSQPHLYWMVKNHYPELYGRVKDAVETGMFMAEGGMWVEADTNISSGEALIRQFLYGKRFFKEELDTESELLWLPDVFGYSGAMPQIMRGCGVKYFSTQKIFWAYHGGQTFPYNTFVWEGIDGSEVLVHLHNDYNSRTAPVDLADRWRERVQKDGIRARLVPFGYGDGGGGATREHLEYLRREADLEGLPRTRMANPIEYFKELEAELGGWPDERYVGELYFQAHRGTYTSQAATKKGNRKSELALREAEIWGTAAQVLANSTFSQDTIDEAWRIVLLNQFHDILPGSSIHQVYVEAEAEYDRALGLANDVTQNAMDALTEDGEGMVVFNSTSWSRNAIVHLPEGWTSAREVQGNLVPVQATKDGLYAFCQVPACGWNTLLPVKEGCPADKTCMASTSTLENDLLRLEFDEYGQIISIYDKELESDWAAGECNVFRMYKDVPTKFDAWDIDSMYVDTPVELDGLAEFEVIESGGIRAVLRITRKLHNSLMSQDVVITRGSRRVDFQTRIDWQERHRLLKVNFPVSVHSNEALHQIQFGYLARPNHKSNPFDGDRFEVCNHHWTALVEANRGAAVLNDCKYGVNVLDNSINLTLLKAAIAPDMTADLGEQTFTYAFYAWPGSFYESGLVAEGYKLNVPVRTMPGQAAEGALFDTGACNIVVEAVKLAADGSGDVIVRLYEALRNATSTTLTTSLPVARAYDADMLENVQGEFTVDGGTIALDFKPFEIKTLRLSF